jgi:hypothetical protein
MYGSGGSHNIIIKALYQNYTLIIKIIPLDFYHNTKIKPDFDKLEIKFYQFFTQKYLLTNRTPNIVGIYNYQHCSHIEKLIKDKLLKASCPSFQERLTKKKLNQTEADNYLCDILLRKEMKLITSDYDMALLEYCDWDMESFLHHHLSRIKKAKNPKDIFYSQEGLTESLEVIIFQIIFTLAIIKDDHPGFLHGDLFLRNILIKRIHTSTTKAYNIYHYRGKKFYIRANGPMAKINDFGMTIIANEIGPNVFDPNTDPRLMFNATNYDCFSKKTDSYNFFSDLHWTILGLSALLNIPKRKINPISKMISKYFDAGALGKIKDQELLGRLWHIKGIKVLEDTLKTPEEYLEGKYFAQFEKLDPEAKIINNYNDNYSA